MEDYYEHNMEEASLEVISDETYGCSRGCGCHEGECEIPAACNNVFYQSDLVSVPVKVVPFAKAGPCTTVCCGSPIITSGDACLEIGRAHV